MKMGLKGILSRKKGKGSSSAALPPTEAGAGDSQSDTMRESASSDRMDPDPAQQHNRGIPTNIIEPATTEQQPVVPMANRAPQDPSPPLVKKDDEVETSNGGETKGAEDLADNTERSELQPTLSWGPSQHDYVRHSSFSSLASDISDALCDDPTVASAYEAIPVIEQIKLPRGGISMETQAVGMIQFGIPPETIKDSMRLGLSVPSVYVVPVERFCREMGPALGVNLAEFEFPAYFNFFVNKKQCTLIVDSDNAEQNIRRVFSETLLGPAQFRREEDPIAYEEEDFAPDFPRDAIPNFQKELKHFRIMPDGKELVLETLLNFCHFAAPGTSTVHENLAVPPPLSRNASQTATPITSPPGSTEFMVEAEDEADISEGIELPKDLEAIEQKEEEEGWTYSQARWNGDVATVYPPGAKPGEIEARKVKRVEIFKMPGGTEYILHDVDEHNQIVGKARFSGHVKVSETMAVDGFGGLSIIDDAKEVEKKGSDSAEHEDDEDSVGMQDEEVERPLAPPTFHPPSFGVTVLGNSHGFDKSGSVSGYVLWINGRGVMIDPPPYSSATLEREGIRPRTIVGIILTHCHADHDAGAFQKVLTGSQVAVITTPTIYKSFIRKYAALSALSPALLRHSHRHRPAIIGQPLRFQGATFNFTYSLHTIPCIGFRVSWRGRSMVFTGDHFNSPPAIDKLEDQGVLTKARADDLRNLPLQETDLLLHEAGAPPIHTPLDVLLKLPPRVKKRLYVVHTSTLPPDCELRVAPTGTAGTIRLDRLDNSGGSADERSQAFKQMKRHSEESVSISLDDDGTFSSSWASGRDEYGASVEEVEVDDLPSDPRLMATSFANLAPNPSPSMLNRTKYLNSTVSDAVSIPPLVSLRPASSTDAWFILNLLSAVPFLSSLSYASTMEVLESARVDAYFHGDVVVPRSRRNTVLCVVWEGTCVEKRKESRSGHHRRLSSELLPISEGGSGSNTSVWYAGDWTGPIALQPERKLSGESELSGSHDIVAMSSGGVKVITVEFSSLHAILNSGSPLYRKYLARRAQQERVAAETPEAEEGRSTKTELLLNEAQRNMNVLELLDCNSALRKLTAVQKRHLESLAEGPLSFQPGERMWRAGTPVDKAFVVVSGTASFLPKRRNAGSAGMPPGKGSFVEATRARASRENSVGESMREDAILAVKELSESTKKVVGQSKGGGDDGSSEDEAKQGRQLQLDTIFKASKKQESGSTNAMAEDDYMRLSRGLQQRADFLQLYPQSGNYSDTESEGGESQDSFTDLACPLPVHDSGMDQAAYSLDNDRRASLMRRRSSRARFANKVLGRLYSRRAFTAGFVFSRGHFLGDVSKMVAGLLASKMDSDLSNDPNDVPKYGFGDSEHYSPHAKLEYVSDMTILEESQAELTVHTSTLTAGKDGCVVLVFSKANLIPFLDEYPGLLMSLLGTQVVV